MTAVSFVMPDTNVLLRALRERDSAEAFRRFVSTRARRMALAAPVEMELRAGARTPTSTHVTERLIRSIGAYRPRCVPSAVAFAEAGRVFAALGGREGVSATTTRGSFITDVLIAVTCREHDAVLVTENAADFARIQRHLRGFRFMTAWPA